MVRFVSIPLIPLVLGLASLQRSGSVPAHPGSTPRGKPPATASTRSSSTAAQLLRRPANADLALQGRSLSDRLLQTAATTYGLDPARDPETRMANRIVTEELSPTDAIESAMALASSRLAPSTDRKPFDLRGTARPVIEEVAKAYGIRTIFEADFQSNATVTFRTGELTRDEAFRSIEAATNTFFVPVSEQHRAGLSRHH